MSNRVLAMGIAESVSRVTPPAQRRTRRIRLGAVASMVGWAALIVAVLSVLRALA